MVINLLHLITLTYQIFSHNIQAIDNKIAKSPIRLGKTLNIPALKDFILTP